MRTGAPPAPDFTLLLRAGEPSALEDLSLVAYTR